MESSKKPKFVILLRTRQKIIYHALSLRYFEIISKHQNTLAFIQFPVIHKKFKNHKYMCAMTNEFFSLRIIISAMCSKVLFVNVIHHSSSKDL